MYKNIEGKIKFKLMHNFICNPPSRGVWSDDSVDNEQGKHCTQIRHCKSGGPEQDPNI